MSNFKQLLRRPSRKHAPVDFARRLSLGPSKLNAVHVNDGEAGAGLSSNDQVSFTEDDISARWSSAELASPQRNRRYSPGPKRPVSFLVKRRPSADAATGR